MTEAVSHKFNSQMPTYLPKISKQLNDLIAYKEKAELKSKTDDSNVQSFSNDAAFDPTEIQSIKFLVKNLKTELDF